MYNKIKTKQRTPQTMGTLTMNQQEENHRFRPDSRLATGGVGLKYIQLKF